MRLVSATYLIPNFPLTSFPCRGTLTPSSTYGSSFSLTFVSMSLIAPLAFQTFYSFTTTQQGLVFTAVLIGVVIGEQAAGPVSDWVIATTPKGSKEGFGPSFQATSLFLPAWSSSASVYKKKHIGSSPVSVSALLSAAYKSYPRFSLLILWIVTPLLRGR
jgi:hypothetical protein